MGPVLFIYSALCTTPHTTETKFNLVSQQYLEPTLGGGTLAVMGTEKQLIR